MTSASRKAFVDPHVAPASSNDSRQENAVSNGMLASSSKPLARRDADDFAFHWATHFLFLDRPGRPGLDGPSSSLK